MNTSGILFHVYMPKNFAVELQGQRSLLLGSYSSQPSDGRPRDERSFDAIIVVSIFGACKVPDSSNTVTAADAFYHPGNRRPPLLHVLGQFGPTDDMSLIRRQIKFTTATETSPAVWLSFDPIGALYQIFIRSHRVPLGNVILLEYDPYSLSRCLICQEAKHVGVPGTVVESFTLVGQIPLQEKQPGFVRLIPQLGERRRRDSRTGVDEDDEDFVQEEGILQKLKDRGIFKYSYGLRQMLCRFSSISKLTRQQTSWIPVLNILALIMVDVFLGTILTCYLNSFPFAFEAMQDTLGSVLVYLKRLLNWLHGEPAGLKLNTGLNSLLFRFFHYNMDLWKSYIEVIQPLLAFILHTIINMGYLGLTIQVSFIIDLLCAVTFHIYCIYIYAARLFGLELYTVKSCARLFFGKKWNPLRSRHDSVRLTHTEMYMCSMIFTISVFLIPTTMIYYFVFVLLRLPIITVVGLLSIAIQFMNGLELVTAYLVFTNSPWIADAIYIKLAPPSNQTASTLRYQILTQTSRKYYKVPEVKKHVLDVLHHIIHSKVL